MSEEIELDEVMEGGTRLLVPRSRTEKGPGTIQGSVFYNRQMSFNRDVSVMFFSSPMVKVEDRAGRHVGHRGQGGAHHERGQARDRVPRE